MDGRRSIPCSRLGFLVTLALLVGCKSICVNTNSKITTDLSPTYRASGLVSMPVDCPPGGDGSKVAVIDVDGLLVNTDITGLLSGGENPVALFHEKLDAAAADPGVRAVVLRINSYGGGVTASDIMRHDLLRYKERCRRPVVACLMDVGAGGAYYLATAADAIVAHPTTLTGGIGVILNLYNLQDAMAQFNVVSLPVKAGENVDLGTPVNAPTEEQRALLQAMADQFHARFRQAVIESRPRRRAENADDFDGRVFPAPQALERGLIDQVGYLDEALTLARQMAGAPAARAVLFHRPKDKARTPYDVTPWVPAGSSLLPLSIPGLERTKLPTFLYIWQPEPTIERLQGK